MDIEKNTNAVENAQIVEDKTRADLEKLAAEYADKDPAMADDLKKLAKSRLSLESFNEYMRLRNEQDKIDVLLANEKRHREKVLAKRRKASKNAKKMRKLNRKRH